MEIYLNHNFRVILVFEYLLLLGKFYIYQNTEHAFFNDERKEIYNKNAAEKSFDRTIEFLNKSFN